MAISKASPTCGVNYGRLNASGGLCMYSISLHAQARLISVPRYSLTHGDDVWRRAPEPPGPPPTRWFRRSSVVEYLRYETVSHGNFMYSKSTVVHHSHRSKLQGGGLYAWIVRGTSLRKGDVIDPSSDHVLKNNLVGMELIREWECGRTRDSSGLSYGAMWPAS